MSRRRRSNAELWAIGRVVARGTRRAAFTVVGFVLVGLGLAGLLLPVLPGWVLIIAGFAVLSREYSWAGGALTFTRRHAARSGAAVRSWAKGRKRAAVRAVIILSATILGVTAGIPAAVSAPSCGRPEDAPAFETPAKPGVVPNTVCMDLQLAQDKAQAAGFYRLASEDASGRHRHQFVDRNWVVISQTPLAGTTATADTGVRFRVLAYGDPGAPAVPDRSQPGRMPKLRCFQLQEAQDTLQSEGFTRMRSTDDTGRHRHQFFDRNWVVTKQTPVPGGTYDKRTLVSLAVVKKGEPSPC